MENSLSIGQRRVIKCGLRKTLETIKLTVNASTMWNCNEICQLIDYSEHKSKSIFPMEQETLVFLTRCMEATMKMTMNDNE